MGLPYLLRLASGESAVVACSTESAASPLLRHTRLLLVGSILLSICAIVVLVGIAILIRCIV
jgi:hypothetical protein